jgi:hypothetical protein
LASDGSDFFAKYFPECHFGIVDFLLKAGTGVNFIDKDLAVLQLTIHGFLDP